MGIQKEIRESRESLKVDLNMRERFTLVERACVHVFERDGSGKEMVLVKGSTDANFSQNPFYAFESINIIHLFLNHFERVSGCFLQAANVNLDSVGFIGEIHNYRFHTKLYQAVLVYKNKCITFFGFLDRLEK